MINKSINVSVLFLSLVVGCSTVSAPSTTQTPNEKLPVSSPSPSAVQEPQIDRARIENEGSKTLDCDDLKSYSLEEGTVPGTNSVNIVSGGRVLHTIKLFTDIERNGFAFDGAKKNSDGFEISIEYGSVIYYHKVFIFICSQHNFYLSKIKVDSFNRNNPEKGTKKIVRVQPKLPLEKFSIADFMLEGVVQH